MYQLRKKQKIPISIDKAWTFFSNPENLGRITPASMKFKILSRSDAGDMYPGMIITYRLSPMFKIQIKWTTEITQVKEKVYFIDNQINGPYKIWHHEHRFKAISKGVEMEDILYYDLSWGILGKLAYRIYIRQIVDEIFNFRSQKIKELFGTL